MDAIPSISVNPSEESVEPVNAQAASDLDEKCQALEKDVEALRESVTSLRSLCTRYGVPQQYIPPYPILSKYSPQTLATSQSISLGTLVI
jgi:hypothetical protein